MIINMKRITPQFLILALAVIIFSCGPRLNLEAENYKNARLVTLNDSIFLKLNGRRVYLHDTGIYEDSILIFMPQLNGRINGSDLPAQKGYYKYLGFILMDSNKVKVNLLLDNTDDKRIDTSAWNGEYYLIRSE